MEIAPGQCDPVHFSVPSGRTLYRGVEYIQRLDGGANAESIYERYRHGAIVIETGEMNMRSIFTKRS